MELKMSPRRLLQELAERASLERTIFLPERYMDMGKDIPEKFLPGRFLMKLSPEKREILSQLKSDDIKYDLAGEALCVWRQ